jgi:hypothetical protein
MKRSVACVSFVVLLVAPTMGRTQTFTLGTDHGRDPYESDQHLTVEARFAPWQPDIDSEFGGRATPFYDYFGYTEGDTRRVRDRLLGGVEVDWQALRLGSVMSLGLGVGVSYSAFGASAPITSTGQDSGQESSVHFLPMYGVLVARVDVLARRTVVPLVLYAKGGVAVTHWWMMLGDDFARRSAGSPVAPDNGRDLGRSARGFSYGWQLAAGAMLRLDFLEPRAQRSWDLEMGVNHSYLFAEYMVVTDWNRPQLHVASNTWVFGIAFDI